MCALHQSSPHHHQTTITSKFKAPRRFNVLASEDTHSDYFRRSLVASTKRRVRFSSTIIFSYPIPLDGEEDEGEEETNTASSPSHCFTSSWYTSAELSTFRADATEAVLRYRTGDRSVDLHGLEKHVIPATTTTTTAPPSFIAARRNSASSYHHHRHQSSPPPVQQRKAAPLNNTNNNNNNNNTNNTKRDDSATTNSPNSAARAA
jgi:hypothetical protein